MADYTFSYTDVELQAHHDAVDEAVEANGNLYGEASPLNDSWNGFYTIDHLTAIAGSGSIPADSVSGGTVYAADAEFSLDNFSSAASNNISLDDDGLIFSEGIYKLFTFTAAQLAQINVADVPVYIVGDDGSEHFVKHNGAGVVVTKPDSTTLKVQLNAAIFTELGITKVFSFFVTNGAGFVTALGVDGLIDKLCDQFIRLRTWQNVTASRVANVTYTNNEPYPISVSVSNTSTSGGISNTIIILVDGQEKTRCVAVAPAASTKVSTSIDVFPGETYSAQPVGGSIDIWSERRI